MLPTSYNPRYSRYQLFQVTIKKSTVHLIPYFSCQKITDKGVQSLAEGLKNLQALHIITLNFSK